MRDMRDKAKLCGRRVYWAACHFISACYHPVEMWLFWEFCSWPCVVLCCALCLLLLCYVCSIVSRWRQTHFPSPQLFVCRAHQSRIRDASHRRQRGCCCRVITAVSYYTDNLAVHGLCVEVQASCVLLLQKRCVLCARVVFVSLLASLGLGRILIQDKLLRNLRTNNLQIPN